MKKVKKKIELQFIQNFPMLLFMNPCKKPKVKQNNSWNETFIRKQEPMGHAAKKEESNPQDYDTEEEYDDNDDNDNCPDDLPAATTTQETLTESASDIQEDVKNLSKNELIGSQCVANAN